MIYAKLKVLPPDPEIAWMDSKTVKLNCLALGELWKWAYFPQKVEYSFKLSPVSETGPIFSRESKFTSW